MIVSTEELTAQDRCDRCGSRAYVKVVFESGQDLLFCGHHWLDNEKLLSELEGVHIQNELNKLTDQG